MIEYQAKRNPGLAFCTCAVIWLTVFATFSLPGRGQPGAGEIDFVARIKIAGRLVSIVLLGWMLFANFRARSTRQIFWLHLIWAFFVLWAIFSTTWSPNRSITLGQSGGQVALLLLSICVAISPERYRGTYLMHCLCALMIYSAIYGVGAILLPDSIDTSRSSDKRFVHPTALAATAALGIIATTSLLLTQTRWQSRRSNAFDTGLPDSASVSIHQPIGHSCSGDGHRSEANDVVTAADSLKSLQLFAILALPVFVTALLVARNRTSIALTAGLCAILFVTKGRSHILAAAGILLAVLGVLYMVGDPGLVLVEKSVGSSIDFLQRGQTDSQLAELSGRDEMWSKMWESYQNSPIIGHGYFMCSGTGSLYVWFIDQNHTAHNILLQALVSSGLVGLILFLIWNMKLLHMIMAPKRSMFYDSSITTLATALFVWFAGWSMMNSSILGPIRPESAVYAIATGLVAGHFYSNCARTQQQSLAQQDARACIVNSFRHEEVNR